MPTVLRAGPSHDSVADSMEDMMRAYKTQVSIPSDHQLAVTLPDDFPAGPAEMIILVGAAKERSDRKACVKLADVLAREDAAPTDADFIADALRDLRRERERGLGQLRSAERLKEDS